MLPYIDCSYLENNANKSKSKSILENYSSMFNLKKKESRNHNNSFDIYCAALNKTTDNVKDEYTT